MTPNYSTRELIELSLLDVMGLLDETERAGFERAFARTSSEVQAHIRREQTRLAHIDFLLPNVEPPADLRSMVLDAVRKAMSEGVAEEALSHEAFMPALVSSRRVSPLWRAGAIGFATAAVVLGYTSVYMQGQYQMLDSLNRDNAAADQALTGRGGALDSALFNANIRHVVFKPTATGTRGKAVLLLNDKDGEAYLVCRNLPAAEGREYKLVVVDDKGEAMQELTQFTSNGFTSKPLTVKLASHQRLAILPPADSAHPSPSPILMTEQIGA